MKNSFIKKFFRIISFLFSCFFFTQTMANIHFTESFTSPNFPVATWSNGSYTLSSGNWDVQYVMGLEAINSYNASGHAVKLNRFLETYLTTPAVNSVGTVSFYYCNFSSSLGGGTFKVQKSVNGGSFTDITTITFTAITAYTYCSLPINEAGSNVKIRIYCPAANTSYLCIDEFMVTDLGQTLAANPTSLQNVSYYYGNGPSTAQSFNLFGSSLSGSPGVITLTAPADYEISTDQSTFSSTLPVAYSGATLPATPIYVRLRAGLPINSYNSEIITIAGGGATTINVACSGNVTAAPQSLLTLNPTSLSGFNYVFGSGPSVVQSYSIIGTDLTGYPGNIAVEAPADYEVSLDYVTFSDSLNIPYTSATLASVIVYVRLKAGLAVNTYNAESITHTGGGAASGTIICNGSVSPPPSPTLSANPSSLSGFTYIVGSGPSTAQSYQLSGANLTGYPSTILITAPTDYEISLSAATGYASNINVSYTSAALSSTAIYVRLKAGLTVASYNSESISHTGGGAPDVLVYCNGNVTTVPAPSLQVSTGTLSGFTYVTGTGPSASQSYTLSGANLTGYPGNIAVTAPANYEVSTNNATFLASIDVPYTSATLSSTPVYVRLKAGLAVASYNSEIITHTGSGAATVNVTCNGTVTAVPAPELSVSTTTLAGFSYVFGTGPSSSQYYNLSGTNLTGYPGNIVVSAPSDYEISTDNTIFSAFANVAFTSPALTSVPIFVRLKSGLAVSSYNSEIISHTGGGAASVDVSCNGTVNEISTSCGNETFSNIPGTNASSYAARTWTGDDGDTWNATSARTDQTLTGKAICFKGYVESPVLPNGIGDLTVTTRFPFSDGTFNLPVLVNGTQVGTVPVSTGTTTTTLTGINLSGNIQIKFQSDGTKRPVIDDLSWTCYVVTGMQDAQAYPVELFLYPNPSNGLISLRIPETTSNRIVLVIFDHTGQMVHSETLSGQSGTPFTLDVNDLKPGFYIVNVATSDYSLTKKFIKE